MVIRKDVSVIQNKWHNAQRVDQEDLETEQNHNNEINAAIVQNYFGSGVLISSPQQKVLFDSNLVTLTDGTGISPLEQPSDSNLGNQLEVELTESDVVGRFSVKVAVVGLSFDNTLQMDRFYFHRNEKQVTSKHYKRILSIFTNDFKGNENCSRELGGRLIIREVESFQLSRDPVMVAQDLEPDIFWRDFKVADLSMSLSQMIQEGIGSEYSVDGLDINTTGLTPRKLEANDVTSQIGQKFLASTNNIQKITLLLGVDKNTSVGVENQFDWTGDLVISLYGLQTSVDCPTDIVPSLAIDFDPSSTPLAQLSYNQNTLQEYGYVLTDVPQPIDFVFNSTIVSLPNRVIESGKLYAVTIKRSGAATSGTLFTAIGRNRIDNSCLTLFSGGVWVDVDNEHMWFQVWTDAAKVADGQGYDNGVGILFTKTTIDESTGATIDNQVGKYSFISTGENIVNAAVLGAVLDQNTSIQDERTGNPVFSRQKFIPSFSFVTETTLDDLKLVSEPLVIGGMQDSNPKINPTLVKTQNLPGLAKGDMFCIVNPDADLLGLNLLGSKLIPDNNSAAFTYRIVKTQYCVDGYGDVNGDGYIDSQDIALVNSLIGESYHLSSTQQKIVDGEISTLELLRADVDGDGYVTANDADLINQYVNKSINSFPAGSSFTHLCLQVQQSIGRNDGYYDCADGYVRLDGYTGLNLVNPDDLTSEELTYYGFILTPLIETNSIFSTVPFSGIEYTIQPQPFWQPYLLGVSSRARQVACTLSSSTGIEEIECDEESPFGCEDRSLVEPDLDPGRNDFYVPDNLYVGKGQILRPDGEFYPIDLEIGTVILQLPQIPLNESVINVFDKFVADRGDGLTVAGYPAMRYADCSTVQPADLSLGRVRFNVSLQSFSPNLDGYSPEDGYGVIVDDIIGVLFDSTTGILRLTIKDLYVDDVFKTLVSKIQILVYLKKAGWKNSPLIINTSEVAGLISS